MSAQGVLRLTEGGLLAFWCPGCQRAHSVNSGWKFNGDFERPTFAPSIKVTWRTFTDAGQRAYEEWLARGTPPLPPSCHSPFESTPHCCHSFVRDGQIQFLGDCTHALAGKTVPLEAF